MNNLSEKEERYVMLQVLKEDIRGAADIAHKLGALHVEMILLVLLATILSGDVSDVVDLSRVVAQFNNELIAKLKDRGTVIR